MEIIKLNIVGTYLYKSDLNNILYDCVENNGIKECLICKNSLLEPSYEFVSNNNNLQYKNKLIIGKCGHIFHNDCLTSWLNKCDTCPIDNVKWYFHKIADTTTELVTIKNSKKRINNNI